GRSATSSSAEFKGAAATRRSPCSNPWASRSRIWRRHTGSTPTRRRAASGRSSILEGTAMRPLEAPRLEEIRAARERIASTVLRSVLVESSYPGMEGLFIHPVSDLAVIAGHGTIGLEILEDLPDVDAILVPYGGGGLSSGIAAAARALKPGVKIFACEVATAA